MPPASLSPTIVISPGPIITSKARRRLSHVLRVVLSQPLIVPQAPWMSSAVSICIVFSSTTSNTSVVSSIWYMRVLLSFSLKQEHNRVRILFCRTDLSCPRLRYKCRRGRDKSVPTEHCFIYIRNNTREKIIKMRERVRGRNCHCQRNSARRILPMLTLLAFGKLHP